MKKTLIISALLAVVSNVYANEHTVGFGKVYKYKNANGEIVYTDIVPSQERSEITIFSAFSGMKKHIIEEALSSEDIDAIINKQKEEKEKKLLNNEVNLEKKKLLSKYENIEEIKMLMSHELDQINDKMNNQINMIAYKKDYLNKVKLLNNETEDSEVKKIISEIEKLETGLEDQKVTYNKRKEVYLKEIEIFIENN